MAKKGRKLTGKALASARRNIKKAQAARGSGNPKRKTSRRKSTRRRSTPRLIPKLKLASTIRRQVNPLVAAGTGIAGTVAAVGGVSAVTGLLAGRTALHPLGGLEGPPNLRKNPDGTVKNLIFRDPFGPDRQVSSTLIDTWALLAGTKTLGGQPDTSFANRWKAYQASTGYNIRSSFTTGGGIAATYGMWAGGTLAAIAIPVAARLATNVAGMVDRTIDGIGAGR